MTLTQQAEKQLKKDYFNEFKGGLPNVSFFKAEIEKQQKEAYREPFSFQEYKRTPEEKKAIKLAKNNYTFNSNHFIQETITGFIKNAHRIKFNFTLRELKFSK